MPCQVVCIRGDRGWPVGPHENMRWLDGMPVCVFPADRFKLCKEVDPDTSDNFFVVTILDRDEEEMKAILEDIESDQDHIHPFRRKWRFHRSSMPAGIRRQLEATGRCAVSISQIRKHLKHRRTGEAF